MTERLRPSRRRGPLPGGARAVGRGDRGDGRVHAGSGPCRPAPGPCSTPPGAHRGRDRVGGAPGRASTGDVVLSVDLERPDVDGGALNPRGAVDVRGQAGAVRGASGHRRRSARPGPRCRGRTVEVGGLDRRVGDGGRADEAVVRRLDGRIDQRAVAPCCPPGVPSMYREPLVARTSTLLRTLKLVDRLPPPPALVKFRTVPWTPAT